MSRSPSDIVPLQLRLTEALRRKIERAAEKNGRSLNSEMVLRLTQSFVLEDAAQSAKQGVEDLRQMQEDMRQLRERLDRLERKS
jgi:uncharacterized protein (DUF1778 family)